MDLADRIKELIQSGVGSTLAAVQAALKKAGVQANAGSVKAALAQAKASLGIGVKAKAGSTLPMRATGREAQMDLVDLARSGKREAVFTNGAKNAYILLLVDSLSRYVWYEDLPSKSKEDVLRGLEKLFSHRAQGRAKRGVPRGTPGQLPIPRHWDRILADGEAAWMSAEGQQYFADQGIELVRVRHAPQIESVIGILKRDTAVRQALSEGKDSWTTCFREAVDAWNQSANSQTGPYTPAEVARDARPPKDEEDGSVRPGNEAWVEAAERETLRVSRRMAAIAKRPKVRRRVAGANAGTGQLGQAPLKVGDLVRLPTKASQGPLRKPSDLQWQVKPARIAEVKGGKYRVEGARKWWNRDEILPAQS